MQLVPKCHPENTEPLKLMLRIGGDDPAVSAILNSGEADNSMQEVLLSLNALPSRKTGPNAMAHLLPHSALQAVNAVLSTPEIWTWAKVTELWSHHAFAAK